MVDERYAGLIEAIYRGQPQVHVETEVTFEDGRKGRIEADLADPRHRRPCRPWPGPPEHGCGAASRRAVLLAVDNISLRFGGVRALSDVSFDVRQGEIRAIIGPNGAGKSSMLNVINGFYQPQEGEIRWKGGARRRR